MPQFAHVYNKMAVSGRIQLASYGEADIFGKLASALRPCSLDPTHVASLLLSPARNWHRNSLLLC